MVKNIFYIFILLVFFSCKSNPSSNSSDDSGEPTTVEPTIVAFNGVTQKGPYVQGSTVEIFEVDNNLETSGASFLTTISDNTGRFSAEQLSIETQVALLSSQGFYFDEVAGELSQSQLNLQTLVEISDSVEANINILTHLEVPRIRTLYRQSMGFRDAKNQARSEVLEIFGFESDTTENSEELDITKSGESNAQLLAASILLIGLNTTAELSELLSRIAEDLSEDGQLTNQELGSELMNAARIMSLDAITNNLKSRYSDLGQEVDIPEFKNYIQDFINSNKYPFTLEVDFPENGNYGKNVLNKELTNLNLTGEADFSFRGEPSNKAPMNKIVVKSLSGNVWVYEQGSNINLTVGYYDYNNKEQVFTVNNKTEEFDLKFGIIGNGKAKINYYEFLSDTVTYSKVIDY
ncbi:MAG: hypothetical protein WD016_05925 [Balneolaceae bacterium]